MAADVTVTIDTKLVGNIMKEVKKVEKTVAKNGDMMSKTFDKVGGKWKLVSSSISKSTRKAKMEFQGWAMSIMFFGMALKRTFDLIWKSSTKTFNDVMSSVEGNVTSFQMLDGALKFLGFTAGQALEPIAAWLIPIVDKVSVWISENEKLFAGIVVGLGVFGTLFSIIGSGVLAVSGFVQAFSLIGPAAGTAGTAATAGLSGILVVLGWVTVAIAAAVLLWKTNFGGFQDNVRKIWTSLVENIKHVWGGVVNIVGGIWDILVGIFEGNGNLIMKGIMKVLIGVIEASMGLTRFIRDFILGVVNFIIQAAIDLATMVPKILLGAMRDVTVALGLDTGLIDKALGAINTIRAWDPMESLGINSATAKMDAMQDKALQVAGDFIINIDTADDADGLITQIQDAVSRG